MDQRPKESLPATLMLSVKLKDSEDRIWLKIEQDNKVNLVCEGLLADIKSLLYLSQFSRPFLQQSFVHNNFCDSVVIFLKYGERFFSVYNFIKTTTSFINCCHIAMKCLLVGFVYIIILDIRHIIKCFFSLDEYYTVMYNDRKKTSLPKFACLQTIIAKRVWGYPFK